MRTTFNIQVQKGTFTADFARFDETQLRIVASAPWGQDGKDFSQRIWKNYQQELPSYLMDSLFRATVMGWGPQKIGQMMHARFQDVQRNKIHNLVTSEMGHIAEEATAKSYEESDIDEYEYMATLESHTCDVCGHLDGEHFRMSERKVGTNYPLIHPRCRCTTVPYIEGMPKSSERWMRDPETGKGRLIKNMKFDEWKKQYSGDYLKSSPWVSEPKMDGLAKVPKNLQHVTINAANRVIGNNAFLKSRLKDSKAQIIFDSSFFYKNQNAIGGTPFGQKTTIILNPAYYNSESKLAGYLHANQGWFVKVKPSQLRTYPIIHELGHVFHNELYAKFKKNNPTSNMSRQEFVAGEVQKIYNIFENKYQQKVTASKLPSGYSRQATNEAFAELFTLAEIGYDSKWKTVMLEYLRTVNK